MMSPTNKTVILKSELPWSMKEMWLRLIIYYILISTLLFILQFGIGSFLSNYPDIENITQTILFSINGILGIGLTWIFLKFDERRMNQIGIFFPDRTLLLLLLAVLATPIALFFGFFIENWFKIINIDKMIEGFISDPIILLLTTLVTFLGIGVGEEIMFRGYIQRLLESNFSFWRAAILTSVLFGMLHSFLLVSSENALNSMIAVGVSATFFGLMFSFAYFKTGRNLILPILLHGIWDLGIFIFNTKFHYDTAIQIVFEIVSQVIAVIIFVVIIYYYAEKFPAKKKLPAWKNNYTS